MVPVFAQAGVAGGEVGGQGGVEDDVEVVPGASFGEASLAMLVDDGFEFVEQFLGAADAEGGDEQGAAVVEGVFDDGAQAVAS